MTTNRIGLALSGGGFRATLFHLGVARYLRDAGMLESISHITSVSGGSIFGAHLCLNWDRYTGSAESFDEAAGELIRFVQLDVRNRIIRRYPFAAALAGARRMLRLERNRFLGRTGMLERSYEKHLFGQACLFDLPATPQLHILATNLSEGVLCSFSREGLVVQRRASGQGSSFERIPAGLATVAMAVTASSAFPGFFPPLRLVADDIGATEGEFPGQAFTDGGVFDNLGVRMFKGITESWMAHHAPLSSRDVDTEGLAEALASSAGDADGPVAFLARSLSANSPRTASEARGSGLPVPVGQDQVDALWHVIVHAHLYRERAFEHVTLQDEDARRYLEFVRATGRNIEWGDHLWLNRQLLSAALQQATGKSILDSGAKILDKVLVSDAGKQFKIEPGRSFGGLVGTAMRASDILMDRVWQLEKEAFEATPGFVSIPISRVLDQAQDPQGLHPEIQRQVARVRTDLDRFTAAEISGLARHGYCVARAALKEDGLLGHSDGPDGPPWDPMPARSARKGRKGQAGHVADEARALQRSSRRRIFGALLSWRDLASYAYIPVLFCLAAIPYSVWSVYQRIAAVDQVLEAISDSSPDVQTVLTLLRNGPVAPWDPLPVEETAQRPVTDSADVDILGDTTFTDLRPLSPTASASPDGSRYAYQHLRLRVRRKSSDDARGRLTIAVPAHTPSLAFRSPNPKIPAEIRRWRNPESANGTLDVAYPFIYGITFDLSLVRSTEPVDVALEVFVTVSEQDTREFLERDRWMRTWTHGETGLLSSWIFFPERAPYESFDVMTAPRDDVMQLSRVELTSEFLIEDGSILGWRLVGAKADHLYELRWTVRQ